MKHNILYILLFLTLVTNNLKAQTENKTDTTINNKEVIPEDIYIKSEIMPEFPGGHDALYKYLIKENKYPKTDKKNKNHGTVIVRFYIDESGKAKGITITKGINECEKCSQESIRLTENMPNWKPGIQNGKPVKVWYSIPIPF